MIIHFFEALWQWIVKLIRNLFKHDRSAAESSVLPEVCMSEKIDTAVPVSEVLPEQTPAEAPQENELPAISADEVLSEKKLKKKQKKEAQKCFENRELSWMKFNERVLEEAEDLNNPLCERLSFLSIYQTNLDEFFMVRIGSLKDQMILNDDDKDNKTHMRPSEQIEAVSKRVRKLSSRNTDAYKELMRSLEEYDIRLTDFASVSRKEGEYLETYFKTVIQPLLSPVIVNKLQPFPFLDNEDLYAVCELKKKGYKNCIGVVPCSFKSLNRLISIPAHKGEYMLSEELILHFIPLIFKQYTIGDKAIIRITRSGDIDADGIYDEDMDYRALMQQLINSRKRLSPVRLEHTRPLNKKLLNRILSYLNLSTEQAFLNEMPLDLSFLSVFRNVLSAETELFFPKRQPQKTSMLDESQPILPQIAKKDVLLYYPYERMNPMIRLLEEASRDPEVTSIQMTLYRVAKNSQIVAALIAAAEAGKEVNVLVELKARFDEENNIHWSHLLEDAGCNVLYGLGSFKVHSKLLLITRTVNGKKEFITQIGTGNYNENTARLYTDLCFMTAKEHIGLEAEKVFDALKKEEFPSGMEHLLVAPQCLQKPVLDMIDEEIAHAENGEPAYIGLKMNSVTDKAIIDKLIEASRAGVRIDMIVRGINCIRSGIEGRTDSIRVISIVGRFLEHARIYIFGTPEREKVYISSADFMTRNTLRRVEVAAPVEEPALRDKIHHIFSLQLSDTVKARVQNAKGNYRHVPADAGGKPLNSQEILYAESYHEEIL